MSCQVKSFNSRLREEATCSVDAHYEAVSVSTHASVRRRPDSLPASRICSSFNSRLREEATNIGARACVAADVSTHASVRRRPQNLGFCHLRSPVSTHASVRRRQLDPDYFARARSFNSRLREEATIGVISTLRPSFSFNSRLREEATHAVVRSRY